MQADKPIKIFITGATGYIGGTVLDKLLHASHQGKWEITALTRSESTIPKFKEIGVTPLIGGLDDTEILTKAASEADVVLHLADADHLPSAKALVQALNSSSTGGRRKIYIHCSGTGILIDEARGEYASDKIYNDQDIESIHAIPITQLHRDVDTYIFENSQNFDSIIVAPPTIHGIGTGPFKRISQQIPKLISTYIKYGKAATLGKGLNVWNNVHVEDLGDFFALLLQKALEGKASVGKEGFYFCESGEHQLKDVVAKVGEVLYKRKLISQAEPVQWTTEEVNEHLGQYGWLAIASNSRCKSDRARALGWKPTGTRGSVFDSIEAEVDYVLNEQQAAK